MKNFTERHHPFEGCFNFRDVGGYPTGDGRSVRWGKYFRGGRQDRMSADDGTSHVVLSPMEFMGRLAALVPRPRVNLTRFHGVFSPRSKLREYAVPVKQADDQRLPDQSGKKVYTMTWAQRTAHRRQI